MATSPSEIVETFAEEPVTTVLVWAADAGRADVLAEAVAGSDRAVRTVLDEGELVQLAYRRGADVLVVEDGPALAAQATFLRVPIVLVRQGDDRPSPRLARHAYAIVARPAEAGLAVDRLLEHRRLAQHALARREPPRRCSRCGRGYDPLAGRKGTARRFVRFGQVTLCGSCVGALRSLLDHAETPWVDGEVPASRKTA